MDVQNDFLLLNTRLEALGARLGELERRFGVHSVIEASTTIYVPGFARLGPVELVSKFNERISHLNKADSLMAGNVSLRAVNIPSQTENPDGDIITLQVISRH